jgi:hypothetical protein
LSLSFICLHHFRQGISNLVNFDNFLLFNFVCVCFLQFLSSQSSIRVQKTEVAATGHTVGWIFSKLFGPWKGGSFSWYKPARFCQQSWESSGGGVALRLEECSGDGVVETGYEGGSGYRLPPYGTTYRSALRTTRNRRTTRGYGSTVDYFELFLVQSLLALVIDQFS